MAKVPQQGSLGSLWPAELPARALEHALDTSGKLVAMKVAAATMLQALIRAENVFTVTVHASCRHPGDVLSEIEAAIEAGREALK